VFACQLTAGQTAGQGAFTFAEIGSSIPTETAQISLMLGSNDGNTTSRRLLEVRDQQTYSHLTNDATTTRSNELLRVLSAQRSL
jgi:hypothetical protein